LDISHQVDEYMRNIFFPGSHLITAMMNDILRDLIDTGDIAAFMDDMLVRTENEKKHNKVVEEILRRMEANDLYLKPEKCV